MTKKPTLVIVLEGGVIQDIVSNAPDSFDNIVVIDYDTDGADPAELTDVPQGDHYPDQPAHVWQTAASMSGIDITEVIRRKESGVASKKGG